MAERGEYRRRLSTDRGSVQLTCLTSCRRRTAALQSRRLIACSYQLEALLRKSYLRRSYVSIPLNRGPNAGDVSQRPRHSSIKIMLGVYGRLIP
jgi:hypothetical protein